jgi:hypothetical protein
MRGDKVKYHLSIDEAVLLEQFKVIKDDTARPMLGMLKMVFKGLIVDPSPKGDRVFGSIQVLKTDSYRLAIWHLDVKVDGGDTGDEFWNDTGLTLYPNGAELGKAIKIIREQAASYGPAYNSVILEPYTDDRDESPTKGRSFIDVQGGWAESLVIPVEATEGKVGTFPNVDKLVAGSLDAEEREDRRTLTIDGVLRSLPMEAGETPTEVAVLSEPVVIMMPAFNTTYLADIPKMLGTTVRQRERFGPIRMTHNAEDGLVSGFELKPPVFCISNSNKSNRLTYVLMPVRT